MGASVLKSPSSAPVEIQLKHDPHLAVISHGWASLAPLHRKDDYSLLWYVVLPDAGPSCVNVSWKGQHSRVRASLRSRRNISSVDRTFLRAALRWMFRADESFADFWNACKKSPLKVSCEARAGALLRSASVFEDVVKTICTTNCHWRNTKRMVSGLCVSLGRKCDLGEGEVGFSFPNCYDLSSARMSKLKDIGLGYRAEYLKEFACNVKSGKCDLGNIAEIQESNMLRERLLEIKGVGSYAAHHIMMLLGHYDFIPCDSEVAAYLGLPTRTPLRKVERTAAARYGHWGCFAFLAYKLDRVLSNKNYVDC